MLLGKGFYFLPQNNSDVRTGIILVSIQEGERGKERGRQRGRKREGENH